MDFLIRYGKYSSRAYPPICFVAIQRVLLLNFYGLTFEQLQWTISSFIVVKLASRVNSQSTARQCHTH